MGVECGGIPWADWAVRFALASCWSVVLQALREARGVTQEGWATWLGVSPSTVQRWERGVAVPTAAVEAVLLAHC